MNNYRRNFLKIFGVTAAALPTISLAGTEIETLKGTREEIGPPLTQTTTSPWKEFRAPYDTQSAQLYSANRFGGGFKSRYECFGYTMGQSVDWKSEPAHMGDTNMYRAKCLSAPEVFLIQRMGIVFSPLGEPIARSEFIDSAVLTLWIGQKMYQRFPVSSIFAVGDRRNASQINPEFPLHVTGKLGLPLLIDSDSTFYVEVEGARDTAPLKAWVVLDGLHARGVC